jgi:hypothetical protein
MCDTGGSRFPYPVQEFRCLNKASPSLSSARPTNALTSLRKILGVLSGFHSPPPPSSPRSVARSDIPAPFCLFFFKWTRYFPSTYAITHYTLIIRDSTVTFQLWLLAYHVVNTTRAPSFDLLAISGSPRIHEMWMQDCTTVVHVHLLREISMLCFRDGWMVIDWHDGSTPVDNHGRQES